jgi:predicted metal-binding protein
MTEEEKLEQIREKALQLGVKTTKLIPADQVVVENRVALKVASVAMTTAGK